MQWEEGTVDNEFLNRKKSKSELISRRSNCVRLTNISLITHLRYPSLPPHLQVCCIYHKAKPKNFEDPFADSSSDSSSGSGSDDEDSSDGEAEPDPSDDRENNALHAGEGGTQSTSNGGSTRKTKKHRHDANCSHAAKKPPPNAYEHQPNYSKASSSKAKKSKGSSTITIEPHTAE